MDRLPGCIFFDILSCTDPCVVVQLERVSTALCARLADHPHCSEGEGEVLGGSGVEGALRGRGLYVSVKAIWPPLPQPRPSADVASQDSEAHVTGEMRTIAVDWLIDVVRRFDAPGSVFDRAVDMFDAHLAQEVVRREELQNVACAAMGAALRQWGDSGCGSCSSVGRRPPIRLEDLTRAMLVIKTQELRFEQMDALELLRLPGPYDYWTRFAVFACARCYSPEQVRHMQVHMAETSRQWLSRLSTSCYCKRFTAKAKLPAQGEALALALCGFVLLDDDFRRWGPEVRGAACALVAALALEDEALARGDEAPEAPLRGALRRWRRAWSGPRSLASSASPVSSASPASPGSACSLHARAKSGRSVSFGSQDRSAEHESDSEDEVPRGPRSALPGIIKSSRRRPPGEAAPFASGRVAALAVCAELAGEEVRLADGLPCCAASLVRLMEKATGPGFPHRAAFWRDPESAGLLRRVGWPSLMVEVAELFEGRI